MNGGSIEIWTVGHSNLGIAEFLGRLQRHGVEVLADVRRFPESRRYPHFGAVALKEWLRSEGIGYEHFPELGGRRQARADSPNTAWRHPAFRGYADYMDTAPFASGIRRLLDLASSGRTAMMCAEALWWQCHRGLIADYLKAGGHRVWHILSGTQSTEHPYTSAARIVDGRLSYQAAAEQMELRRKP